MRFRTSAEPDSDIQSEEINRGLADSSGGDLRMAPWAAEGAVALGMPKPRRHRPWLRLLVVLFVAVEVAISALVSEYMPIFDFRITTVYSAAGEEVGRNPELMFPIKLGGGTLCQAQALEACVEGEFDASDVCCTELFREDSDGPEELISWVMCLAYVGIIPGLILLMRGFLLGRVWDKRLSKDCPQTEKSDPYDGAWGKKRWHLRVGFYSLDSCLGLVASIVTATTFTVITEVLSGRPRPNYYALQAFSERTATGKSYLNISRMSWPSGHAGVSMAGLLFLSFVLWRDLMALVQWRRRAHPKITLVLAVLGGFALAAVPLSAILIAITRIRDYMHRPDDVLAGLVLGSVCAYWSFRFVVIMPFNHEVGAPDWTPEPKWVLEEEAALYEEEDDLMGCWKEGKRRCGHRVRVSNEASPLPAKYIQHPQIPSEQAPRSVVEEGIMKDDTDPV